MTTQTQDGILLAQMKARQRPETSKRLGQAICSDDRLQETLERVRKLAAESGTEDPQQRLDRMLKANRISEGMKAAGIEPGSRFYKARLDGYETPTPEHEKALNACRDACGRFRHGDGLLLLGEPGGGKTHLLVGMLYQAIKDGLSARFITAEEFFLGLRSCMTNGKSEADYISSLVRVDVLALDDIYCLASSKATHDESYQYRMLWHLLDKRYFGCKATVSSTNKALAEFKDMIDERTRRRLQATLVSVPVRRKP